MNGASFPSRDIMEVLENFVCSSHVLSVSGDVLDRNNVVTCAVTSSSRRGDMRTVIIRQQTHRLRVVTLPL